MKKIRIIHSNDIHSRFDRLVNMGYYINKLKNDNTLILDAGDFCDFSSPYTYGTDGYLGLKLLNTLNYQALSIGNNEGFQKVDTIVKLANYNLVNILTCNLYINDHQDIPGIKKSIIKEVGGIRFLIIGASPYGDSFDNYYNLDQIYSVDPLENIKNEIKINKGKYDFVILLSHLGLKRDIFLTQTYSHVDIIIGGHSHHAINPIVINNAIVHQSGSRGSHLGYLDIEIEDNKIVSFSGENIKLNDDSPIDEKLNKEYEELKKTAILNLSKPLFEIPCDLTCSIDKECNYTNILADYIYNNYKSDFCIINSGLTESNIKKGPVSKLDLINSCNSPLRIVTMKIKGKYIKEALIESLSSEKCYDGNRRPGYRGAYLGKIHVSYNCKIIYNKKMNLYVNGKNIDDEDELIVSTTDYFQRGMGYEILKNNIRVEIFKDTILETLEKALKNNNSYKYVEVERWC